MYLWPWLWLSLRFGRRSGFASLCGPGLCCIARFLILILITNSIVLLFSVLLLRGRSDHRDLVFIMVKIWQRCATVSLVFIRLMIGQWREQATFLSSVFIRLRLAIVLSSWHQRGSWCDWGDFQITVIAWWFRGMGVPIPARVWLCEYHHLHCMRRGTLHQVLPHPLSLYDEPLIGPLP